MGRGVEGGEREKKIDTSLGAAVRAATAVQGGWAGAAWHFAVAAFTGGVVGWYLGGHWASTDDERLLFGLFGLLLVVGTEAALVLLCVPSDWGCPFRR